MKRMLFALPLVLCACGEVELPETQPDVTIDSDVTRKFTFTVKGDFANHQFVEEDDISSIPVINEPTDEWGASQRMSRANQYMTADGVEMTDMWVVDYKDGAIQQSLHQSNADDDWGAPTMSLTLGTHHVLFLASRGHGAQYADGVVTWTKPLDTFYLDYDVTVVKTSNGNRAVTLNRCATKATICVEDAIPSGTTSMTLTPSVWYRGWNMLTGEPVGAPSGYNVSFAVPAAYVGVSGVNYSIWSLSSADEWTSDISIVSKAGESVNASAVIEGAPFVANRATVYRGSLYSNASESSVSLNATWLQDYEGVY